jgi:hypothetical protein
VAVQVKLTKFALKYDELNSAQDDLSVTFNKHSAFLILERIKPKQRKFFKWHHQRKWKKTGLKTYSGI